MDENFEMDADRFSPLGGVGCDDIGTLMEICVDDNENEGNITLDEENLDNISLSQTVEYNSPLPCINDNSCSQNHQGSPVESVETLNTTVSTNDVIEGTSIEPPKVGMVFKGWKDIECYYKLYAEECGFGVSRVQGSYTTSKERRGITWKCECYGAPDMRAKREAKKRAKQMDVGGCGGNVNGVIGEAELSRGKRKSKICYCKARVYGSVNREGLWVLQRVELEHNHDLCPSMANLVKEYRMKKMTSTVRKRLVNYYEVGVPVSVLRRCLGTENPNLPNVKDMQHEVYKQRRLKMAGGDAQAMMAYFDSMQADNQNFYHAHRLDDKGRLKDVMWVDARSRVAYEDFGDVVCFDATYLTNEYELPFANFVGVNHHGQSILLGCALVSHEDCDTFRWLFKQWLLCMGNKTPLAILTDQAPAMRKPLVEVMPNTRHRWCMWHILRKFPDKLGRCAMYNDFKSPLKNIVYDSFTTVEFQTRWCEAMKKYGLEDNEWLQELFVERHMWVPAWMKEFFWAGMKTTQRVESINRFFDGFVTRKTRLCEFPEKYSAAMKKRVGDETDADARDAKYIRRLVSGFRAERYFQQIYTDAKFQEVQRECARMLYVVPKSETVISDVEIQYLLSDRVWIVPEGSNEEIITDYRRLYSLVFNPVTKDITCDCRKFEKDGILCKHIIRVFDENLVNEIPSKYVLDRWRKDVMRRHTRVKVAYHDPSQTAECIRYNKLFPDLEALCDEASNVDEDTIVAVREAVLKLRTEVRVRRALHLEKNIPEVVPSNMDPCSHKGSSNQPPEAGGTPMSKPCNVSDTGTNPNNAQNEASTSSRFVVRDPITQKRPHGRPKGSRNKTRAELGYNT
ncbi:protein FAR1-RELATED SEQUENCE 6-like isoform X1 [Chenopodium quinoa]|uniref:protein FAR1-RELATED SEQUENCE 6-like isoform X1 n=1 Tax=Chenopodium quinoa TaxID=63459 RepID=UPI000B77EF35|nr:protein FAR1-RELATED SEQUENCE 6-like isoform X1 [Chenopodium quinoa]XP_021715719.1 protein FAR1-RELATED SEQUENCE 6-like isoform X1 [Chenopodium quinoa]